jgi:hypothetical protein
VHHHPFGASFATDFNIVKLWGCFFARPSFAMSPLRQPLEKVILLGYPPQVVAASGIKYISMLPVWHLFLMLHLWHRRTGVAVYCSLKSKHTMFNFLTIECQNINC